MLATNLHTTMPHNSPVHAEADRLMVVCNSCRYCEGLCAVFPAMEMRRLFTDGDLNYLANLCHGCGACYVDCQFSPPHEFDVNIPRAFARLRAQSYRDYAWPRFLGGLFVRNGLALGIILAACIVVFVAGFAASLEPAALGGRYVGPGAFYALMPHNLMAALFGAVFLYAIVAITIGAVQFWRDIGEPDKTRTPAGPMLQAAHDAARLRYLDGGEGGCGSGDATQAPDRRKLFHHLTFYGFALCFASTVVATGYHYVVGLEAPYAWYQLPVVLGTLGGLGLVVGPLGLLASKASRDPDLIDRGSLGMDVVFVLFLFATGASGLLLLVLRETPLMGMLLALHLGIVFGLFLTMPYGKFVHGLYRYLALVRYAKEQRVAH